MYLILVHILVILLCGSQGEEYKDYKGYKYVEVWGRREGVRSLISFLSENEPLIHWSGVNTTQIILSPHLESIFNVAIVEENLQTRIIHKDVAEMINLEREYSRRNANFSWDAYYDVDKIYKFLKNTVNSYTQWTELIVGGESYEGRKIIGLRINTPVEEGQRETGKPVFFIEAGIHAREWIAPAVATYFINQLLTSGNPNITRLRDQFDWRIFPTVNPDGYHYTHIVDRFWRKTRSLSNNGCIGADPNRNWDYNWGKHSSSDNPCDYQTYAGSGPFSEVETRTLSSYISEIDNLMFYVAFHSYSTLLLIPYSDSTTHVDNYEELVQIGNKSLEYASWFNSKRYSGPGTAAETLYKTSGGSMDWVRDKLNTRLVYTYELRGNSFVWPSDRIWEQGEEVTLMMLGLADGAQELGYF